jgi:hypothetical protein
LEKILTFVFGEKVGKLKLQMIGGIERASGYAKATATSASLYAAAGGKGVEFSRILQGNKLPGENPDQNFSLKPFSRFSLCQATAISKLVNFWKS